jgi:membrane-bound lytic murein transglycosylase F
VRNDKGAIIGSAVFTLLLAAVVFRPDSPLPIMRARAPEWTRPQVARDLGHIQRDTLRVLVLQDALSFDEVSGDAGGLEWRIIRRFAKARKLPLVAIPVADPDTMLLMLQRGQGDIMAGQFCPQGPFAPYVAFTLPYRTVAPIRAALYQDALVRRTIRSRRKEGGPDTLVISRWSSFRGLPAAFDERAGEVVLVPDSAPPMELLYRVALGTCRAAVLSDAQGSYEARRLPHMDLGTHIGPAIPLAFAVRGNSRKLLRALNEHMLVPKEKSAIRSLVASYGNGVVGKGKMRSLPQLDLAPDSISPFDSLFQMHADNSVHDWRLLAALAYKESRFDTAAVSGAGAEGLMQIMPGTASELGVDSAGGVSGHIRGARDYLAYLDEFWRASVPNAEQRLKFVIGSYNAGPGHIKDAQRLAQLFGLDPAKWDGSVERAVLLLAVPRFHEMQEVRHGYCRGTETFWHVRDVISAFKQFKRRPDTARN